MNTETAEAILGRKFWQTKKFQITAVGLVLAVVLAVIAFAQSKDVNTALGVFASVMAYFGINVYAQGRSDESKEAKAVEVTGGPSPVAGELLQSGSYGRGPSYVKRLERAISNHPDLSIEPGPDGEPMVFVSGGPVAASDSPSEAIKP